MSKQFLTVNGISLNGVQKKKGMIKTYSFTTDEDETKPGTDSQLITTHQKSLSEKSPSNENMSSESDGSDSSKILEKRKSPRQIESLKMPQKQTPSSKKSESAKSFDRSTVFMILGILVLAYFMWIKRDIWISRLILSPRFAVRRSILAQATMLSTDSSLDTSKKTESQTFVTTKSNNTDHVNIKIRRTKMNFGSDQPKKKLLYVPDRSTNDTKSVKPSVTVSKNSSSKKHSHTPTVSIRKENSECYRTLSNSTTDLLTYNETLERIRNNLTLRNGNRNILPKVIRKTGLKKHQLYQFLYKKNQHVLSLETFLSLLNIFDLKILIQSTY
ncbi:hypothetical protein I4U23_026975 [Adineta vaga]|nr:hypothetical protein I4U23_026975 [Adineta vaga]